MSEGYLGQSIKDVYPTNVALGGANMGQVPLFQVQWWAQRSAIPAGYVAADGQELSAAAYPDAKNGIDAGNVPTVANGTWISNPSERGKFVALSSTGKFRVPDYNGKFAGSLGAVFLRGDGALSAAVAGKIQLDDFASHTHTLANAGAGRDTPSPYLGVAGVAGTDFGNYSTDTTTLPTLLTSGATGASETRPLNVTGCWVIKLFGAVVNAGSVDAAQLATEIANIFSRTDALENIGKIFTKEYVSAEQVITNGGTINLTHGLGSKYKLCNVVLVCKTVDLGYPVGTELDLGQRQDHSASSYGFGTRPIGATQVELKIAASGIYLHTTNGVGGPVAITPASWRLIVRAWA